MDWSLIWFETISSDRKLGVKRGFGLVNEDSFQRKNIRHTPCSAICDRNESELRGRRKRQKHKGASPQFIINGNKAPSATVLKENFMSAYVIKSTEMDEYFGLLANDKLIKQFLDYDKCFKYADKYLLACVFAYFKRCNFRAREYNRMNFFCCLYIAHDMEEDNEDYKYEIFPWALGSFWREKVTVFLQKKENIWARMNYRAVVSKQCCKELMSIAPEHPIWQRNRAPVHGFAIRNYLKGDEDSYPRGPNCSPRICYMCQNENESYPKKRTRSSWRDDEEFLRFQDANADDSAFFSALEDGANNTYPEMVELTTGTESAELLSFDGHPDEAWLSQETYQSASNFQNPCYSLLTHEE